METNTSYPSDSELNRLVDNITLFVSENKKHLAQSYKHNFNIDILANRKIYCRF